MLTIDRKQSYSCGAVHNIASRQSYYRLNNLPSTRRGSMTPEQQPPRHRPVKPGHAAASKSDRTTRRRSPEGDEVSGAIHNASQETWSVRLSRAAAQRLGRQTAHGQLDQNHKDTGEHPQPTPRRSPEAPTHRSDRATSYCSTELLIYCTRESIELLIH